MLKSNSMSKIGHFFGEKNDNRYGHHVDERGQVLLYVVFLVTVLLTIVMSTLSRSIVNVRLSVEEDESLKALAAAEAGIEKSLSGNTSLSGVLSNESSYTTQMREVQGSSFLLNNGRIVSEGEGADIWLSDYSDDPNLIYGNPWIGTLDIYWGNQSDNCAGIENVNTMAALEVVILQGSKLSPYTKRLAFDPCGSRNNINNFPSPVIGSFSINGKIFSYRATITLNSQALYARVIPIYANTYMAISATPVLPVQGTIIRSTGTSGDTKRTVSILKENPSLPSEFMSYSFMWPK